MSLSATSQSALSTEKVRYPVAAVVLGVVIDPTADTVQMAFPATGVAPITNDWKTAAWETTPAGSHYVTALVGPSGGVITGTVGTTLDVWVKIADNPEIVVRKVGTISFT